jgi:hypothetical protein
MSLRPGYPIADDGLLAARENLAPFLFRQLEPVGNSPGNILHQVVIAVGHQFQERKHDGLKVRYGHDRAPKS